MVAHPAVMKAQEASIPGFGSLPVRAAASVPITAPAAMQASSAP